MSKRRSLALIRGSFERAQWALNVSCYKYSVTGLVSKSVSALASVHPQSRMRHGALYSPSVLHVLIHLGYLFCAATNITPYWNSPCPTAPHGPSGLAEGVWGIPPREKKDPRTLAKRGVHQVRSFSSRRYMLNFEDLHGDAAFWCAGRYCTSAAEYSLDSFRAG